MIGKDKAVLKKVTVGLPFGLGSSEWESDPTERRAAWALYVELVTRIAVQPLEDNQGLLRESLASLYQLFPATREILKAAGPDAGASLHSVGGIAIAVLNKGLRPFLSKWHPMLLEWETQREPSTSAMSHESSWPQASQMRDELEMLRGDLGQYAGALATIAGVSE